VSGVTCAALTVLAVAANPYMELSFHNAGIWVVIIPGLGVGGVFAAVAAIRRRPRVLLMLFFVSFFPFGLYLFLTIPGLFGWVGASHIGYLAAGLILRHSKPGGHGGVLNASAFDEC
jgi:hypothetical protein